MQEHICRAEESRKQLEKQIESRLAEEEDPLFQMQLEEFLDKLRERGATIGEMSRIDRKQLNLDQNAVK